MIKMGRKKKMVDGMVIALRLPKEFLNHKPEDEEYGDWLRGMLIDGKKVKITNTGLNDEQKQSVNYFNDFFIELFFNGTITDQIMKDRPDLLKMAEVFGGIVNE